MTLVELLVVLAIVGLLAVAVGPVLVGNKDKRILQRAADVAESQVSHVISRALGSPSGVALWLEAETSGAGANYAVVDLGFARIPSGATGTVQITNPTLVSGSAGFSATLSSGSGGLASLAPYLPAPIEFAGVPGVFTAWDTATIRSGSTPTTGSVSRNARNAPIWVSGTMRSVPYTLHLPPRPASAGGGESLQDGTCIDLSHSTLGISGYSPVVTPLGGALRVAVCFDRTGRPDCVWASTTGTGGNWSRYPLTAATPIVFSIGLRSQVDATGGSWVSVPDENNPGLPWQNPSARWLLVDAQSGGARVIEVGSSKGQASMNAAKTLALAPVLETFKNVASGQ